MHLYKKKQIKMNMLYVIKCTKNATNLQVLQVAGQNVCGKMWKEVVLSCSKALSQKQCLETEMRPQKYELQNLTYRSGAEKNNISNVKKTLTSGETNKRTTARCSAHQFYSLH